MKKNIYLFTQTSLHFILSTDNLELITFPMGCPFLKYSPNSRRMSRDIITLSHTLKRPAGREKRKEGRNIIIKNMCSLESKAKNKKGILIYMKKKVRIKLIVS